MPFLGRKVSIPPGRETPLGSELLKTIDQVLVLLVTALAGSEMPARSSKMMRLAERAEVQQAL